MIEPRTTVETPPMFREFLELKRQRVPLSTGDYFALLNALDKGYGTSSREALLFTCSTLWAKSRDEQIRIERLLNSLLPLTIKLPEYGEFEEGGREETTPVDAHAPAPTEENTQISSEKSPASGSAVADVRLVENDTFEVSVDFSSAIEPPSWQSSEAFELEPREPVPALLMRRIWRGYRRAGRSGPKVELDVDAAIEQLSRHGTLYELPMRALRLNQSRLLLLVDAGDSMRPFRYATKALIDAANAAGLARLDVRYFRDVPRKEVYEDSDLREAQLLDHAASAFAGQGVMIYSDAGAARGHLEHARVEASAATIKLLLEVTPTVVWLNPAPRRRWRGSSAAAILERSTLPMYPYNTSGLRQAVAALHGKET